MDTEFKSSDTLIPGDSLLIQEDDIDMKKQMKVWCVQFTTLLQKNLLVLSR